MCSGLFEIWKLYVQMPILASTLLRYSKQNLQATFKKLYGCLTDIVHTFDISMPYIWKGLFTDCDTWLVSSYVIWRVSHTCTCIWSREFSLSLSRTPDSITVTVITDISLSKRDHSHCYKSRRSERSQLYKQAFWKDILILCIVTHLTSAYFSRWEAVKVALLA